MNNKGADHTARMRRLVCAFAVRKSHKTGFSHRDPYFGLEIEHLLFNKHSFIKAYMFKS